LFGFAPTSEDFRVTEDREIQLRFFELWTAKEAYAKFLGKGLASISLPIMPVEKYIIDNEYLISIYK
jgi:phosphopantetheinyl transferase